MVSSFVSRLSFPINVRPPAKSDIYFRRATPKPKKNDAGCMLALTRVFSHR
jgi:hypothetical protein